MQIKLLLNRISLHGISSLLHILSLPGLCLLPYSDHPVGNSTIQFVISSKIFLKKIMMVILHVVFYRFSHQVVVFTPLFATPSSFSAY